MEKIGMPHLAVRPDWLAKRVEDPIEPERPIIDPHHHLWERPGARYLFHDYLEDVADGHRILSTVYIQCRSMHRATGPEPLRPVGEVTFAAGAAAMAESGHYGEAGICAGIVGTCDLTLGEDLGPVLDALEAASGGRLRGIRQPVAVSDDPAIIGSVVTPPPGLMLSEAMAAGVRALGARGLTLDIWAFQTQLGEARVLAERAPDTTIIIDHCGGILGIGGFAGKREAAFGAWRDDMAALADLPNVQIKLGGLAMHTLGWGLEARDEPPGSEELADLWRPYIATCIEMFGPERAMFESNFPVDKGQVSYRTCWNAFKRLAADQDAAAQDALFRGTAAETYRLVR